MTATTTDACGWLASLLQTADSFYPTGAYAHSFGLEGLVQSGAVRDCATLQAFIVGQALPSLARTDLPIAAQAWAASGNPPDWGRLRELSFLGAAVRGAREPREASESIGRQRIELAARLHGGFAAEFAIRAREGGWPASAGMASAIEGRTHGAPCEAVLSASIYSTAAGLVAAAIKLLRLGQNAAQAVLREALAGSPALIVRAMSAGPGEVGSFNPWWEIAAARHESADGRMFIS
jgi:urease accessory protein